MDSWSTDAPPTGIKYEHSPADSFLSTPGDFYPPLFGSEAPATLDPSDVMSPRSLRDETPDMSALAGFHSAVGTPTSESSPAPEKKPVKKRKSWGQVLPEPKTNLPPRKRAKTEDEKEQRRVERVLRNRRAAQSSRERKRQEVEGLEKRNKELEEALRKAHQMIAELSKMHRPHGAPAAFEALRPSPLTLSQELFSSHNGHHTADSLEQIQLLTNIPTTDVTVNPASLSPTLNPVAEENDEEPTTTAPSFVDAASTVNTSPDATQHPAAMLCEDLQCRSAEVSQWMAMSQQRHPALALLEFLLISTSTMVTLCQRPLTQIALSLKAGFSLPPTPAILNMIILLVTNPSPSTLTTTSRTTTSRSPSSSRSSNPTAAQPPTRRSSTLRLKLLRKILTCSPSLARPLMDATMVALRLASTEGYAVDQVSRSDVRTAAAARGEAQQQQQGNKLTSWKARAQLPSQPVLISLAWILRAEVRRLEIRQQLGSSPSKLGRPCALKSSTPATSNTTFVLSVSRKRSLSGETLEACDDRLKRRRAE